MNYFSVVTFLSLWISAISENTTEEGSGGRIGSLLKDAQSAFSLAAAAIDEAAKNAPIIGDKIFPGCVEPPAECPNENITFWYYSRTGADTPHKLLVSNPDTLNIPQNQHPWKVIIHGYTKSKDDIPNPQLRSAYFKHGDYNLISVDYEPIARDQCYIQAVHNVPLIANCTAQMLDTLMERNLFGPNDLHVIGFSLGAQVAGLLHEYMKHDKPKRVTGLDPASPLFDGVVNKKLSKDSGKFVDVIHTNGMFKGKLEESGHVDFYVNGGLNQPGCLTNNSGSASTCSHDRSPLYYAESINSPEGFWGIPCNSYITFTSGLCNTEDAKLVVMGEYVPLDARGTYYLQTTDKAPFALGKSTKYSVKI